MFFFMTNVNMLIVMLVFSPLPGFEPWTFNSLIPLTLDPPVWELMPNIVLVLMAGLRGKILDFNQRLEIAIDVAHGLTYLHLYAGQ